MAFTKNQILTLEIESLSSDGNGVTHSEGQAVFVPGTAPGDTAEIRIVKPMKTYAFGRVEKILTPGPGRIATDCPWRVPAAGAVCGIFPTKLNVLPKRGLSRTRLPVWGNWTFRYCRF